VLKQLVSLTRPLAVVGPRACGIAIYADHRDEPFGARETGEEGVACVDDVARALVLWCDLWQRTRLPAAREWVDGLLAFCRWQQQADGRFLNFILDWNGAPNVEGATSRVDGASFWHARGARGLAKTFRVFGDPSARADFERAFAWFDVRPAPADVRSIQILGAIDAGGHDAEVSRWCDELVACRSGDVLLDDLGASAPHLWAHIQEGVLAIAGPALGRPELVAAARRSADAYLLPLVAGGFDLPTVQPYGVASAVFGLDRLQRATGDPRYERAARDARAWFDGRNPAHAPVYDRETGRVADGIDAGRLNPHSGAESNILGAQALIGDVAAWLVRHPDACSPWAPSSRSSDVSSAAS
jgi:hypothetical protein